VDPGELELVVLNLAVNARDAMPNGGAITVRGENCPWMPGRRPRRRLCPSLDRRHGHWHAPDVRDRVFEPFFTTKDIGKGSGLGLAQVHGFATQSEAPCKSTARSGRAPP
jgi:C4-dicarboxylate-specific signal transduction histidine kinase